MNLQQLQYIIALDNHRHFGKAAEACFVTQPTLSMMIHKLEEELQVKIFDRSKKPITPTAVGVQLIEQARVIHLESLKMQDIVNDNKENLTGQLSIGIIPTLAPYLLPLFINRLITKYPAVTFKIREINTEAIISQLKKGELDIGLLATPLEENSLIETPLFYEEFYLYSSDVNQKTYIVPEDINPNELLLLEEGHCLRSQVINLCELRKGFEQQLEFQSGSLETLKRLVERHQAVTIVPELATLDMNADQKKHLSKFKSPRPVREISLVKHRNQSKDRLIDSLQQEIIDNIPKDLLKKRKYLRVEI